jgi:hypothetical protein
MAGINIGVFRGISQQVPSMRSKPRSMIDPVWHGPWRRLRVHGSPRQLYGNGWPSGAMVLR